MNLFNRLGCLVLLLVFYLGLNLYELPVDGVIFMQVEARQDVVAGLNTGSVFTYDKDVMEVLQGVSYTRFSIKVESGEEVISDLFATLICSEEVNGDIVEYYFSPLLESYVTVGGNKVNLQVSETDGVTTIGYPLIDVGF